MSATIPTPGTRPQHTTQQPGETSGEPSREGGGAAAIQRQFVNFACFKLDPVFRRLPEAEKAEARAEFESVFAKPTKGLMCLSYSTAGLRADTDFLLWRIALSSDTFQEHTRCLNKTRLAGYLTTPHNFLAMTKRSMYIDKVDPFHTPESRTHIIPGKRKYLFVYPFVKTRQWYMLPMEKRQELMDVHIRIGSKYPSVKLNTTYSFGLDDQDFVVAFETDEPKDFLDLVMALREAESSLYTQRDNPMFTAVQMDVPQIIDQLF